MYGSESSLGDWPHNAVDLTDLKHDPGTRRYVGCYGGHGKAVLHRWG